MKELIKKIEKGLIDKEIDYKILAKRIGVSESMLYRFLNGQQKSLKSHVLESIKKELELDKGGDDVGSNTFYKLISDYKNELTNAQREIFEYRLKLENIQKELEYNRTELEKTEKELKQLKAILKKPLKKAKKAKGTN